MGIAPLSQPQTRKIILWVFFVYMGIEPIIGPFVPPGEFSSRIFLYGIAGLFGVPLIISNLFIPPISGKQNRSLELFDVFVLISFLYWICVSFLGVFFLNDFKFILSDTFNFLVPLLSVRLAMNVKNQNNLEETFKGLDKILIFAVIPHFLYTFWLSVGLKIPGAGGLPYYVLFVGWHLYKAIVTKSKFRYFLSFVAFFTIVISLKRAVFISTIFYLLLVLVLSKNYRFLYRLALGGLVFFLVFSSLDFFNLVPFEISPIAFVGRIASIITETGGFSHFQGRQDEIVGIIDSVFRGPNPLTVFHGLGMGATYDLRLGETSGNYGYGFYATEYHNSHVSPFGWLLRGGLIGVFLWLIFYFLSFFRIVFVMRSNSKNLELRNSVLFGFCVVACILGLSSFSLTPSPVVHLIMGLLYGMNQNSNSSDSYSYK